jgi:hypothetical protein
MAGHHGQTMRYVSAELVPADDVHVCLPDPACPVAQ